MPTGLKAAAGLRYSWSLLPPPESRTVGFLDDLKRQADALKAKTTIDHAALARNTALADVACKTALSYFIKLAPELNVLRPKSPARFTLDRRNAFDALQLTEFRVDSRRKPLRREEVFDHVVLHWRLVSGQPVEIVKDFLTDIEKLESRLAQSGAQVDKETVRDPESGKFQGMRYRFVADFLGNARLTPLHDNGRVLIQLQNLDGFESVSFELPGFEVGNARMDELARWLAGQPHSFLQDAQGLRRVEA